MKKLIPKYIKIFDNGGDTFDRYTAVDFRKKALVNREHTIISFSPQIYLTNNVSVVGTISPHHLKHLGTIISFESLGEREQNLVNHFYYDL